MYACDLRGHGLSTGKRGYISRFSDYLLDADAFLKCVRQAEAEAPVFLLGHSMGGLIAALYAEQPAAKLPGLILSSPFLRLRMAVPGWKWAASAVLSTLAPSIAIPSGLPLEWISHDTSIVEKTRRDPLSHRDGTPRWFTETLRAQSLVAERAGAISTPVALLIAGDDRIADTEESERFFARLNAPKALHRYEGYYHELFNEIGRENVFRDLEVWLNDTLP